MTGSCPRCDAHIQVDPLQIPEKGAYQPCPECKGRFWQQRESFALRAYKKENRIYCVTCGGELGPSHLCRGCGSLFPSYWVFQKSKPVRRNTEKFDWSIDFSRKKKKQTRVVFPQAEQKSQKKLLVGAALLALVLVLAVGAGKFYLQNQFERDYSANFVVALYGLKSGTDLSLKNCSKISAQWKASRDSGQSFHFQIKKEEEEDLNSVKREIDLVMEKLNNPPEKFSQATEKIGHLYRVYEKLYALNLSPPNSLDAFLEAVNRFDSDFHKAALGMKASFPEELSEGLRKAAPKYRNLQFMIQN